MARNQLHDDIVWSRSCGRPLHLDAGVSAIVNGGIYRTPTLIRRDAGETVVGKRVIPNDIFEYAPPNAAGRRERHRPKASAPGYLVGGKTGTAEKVSGRAKNKALISSFIAAFPMHKPKYVVLAMLDGQKAPKKPRIRYRRLGCRAGRHD